MSAKRIQLRGFDCGSRFIAATARRIAARSGSLADMPRMERRVTTAPWALACMPAPIVASDAAATDTNARLLSMKVPTRQWGLRYRTRPVRTIILLHLFLDVVSEH